MCYYWFELKPYSINCVLKKDRKVTELAVIEALKRRSEIAVLMVTHRTNLMKYASRVFTVQSGELVEKMIG